MKKTFFELVRYILVGGIATIVDYGSYFALTRFFFLTAQTANPIAYLLGHIASFVGHRTISFRSSGHPGHQYLRFFIVNIVGLAISQLTLVALLRFGAHDLIAKAAAVATSGLFNYLANKFWTFRIKY
jgi:putative flippase GtrA